MSIYSFSRDIVRFFTDFIFPQKPSVIRLENMPLHEFAKLETASNTPYLWIHSLFSYKDTTVQELVWHIKYKKNSILIEKSAILIAEKIQADFEDRILFEKAKLYLVPIPLSKKRLRERGFNQSERIADIIKAHISNIYLDTNILIRHKHTLPQTKTLSRKERLHNIVGSFSLQNPKKIKGTYVILLVDVTTTGATLAEDRKDLQQGRPEEIIAYTIAH